MTENHTADLPTADQPAVSDPYARQLLVLPDRDTAEEASEELAATQPDLGELEVVRDALAGEDDAEDAQWLVVAEAPESGWTPALLHVLDTLAAGYEGWREEA